MNKTKLGMLGAVSALVALPIGARAAAPEPAVAPAQSFSELLQPIPNAAERLDASNRELSSSVRLMPAAYHHHHNSYNHHSSAWWRDYYRRLMWQRNHHHHNNDYNNHHHHNNDYNSHNHNHNNNHNHNHNHY